MKMKKYVKWLVIIVVLCIFCSGFYLYKLHALAVEGNKLFEDRCTQVNPILIKYKKAFLKYAEYLNTYPNSRYSEKEVAEFVEEYMSGLREYVPAEDEWLDGQMKFINRWDFQLFETWYIKQGSVYQYDMYKAYREDAANMVMIMDNPEIAKSMGVGTPNPARETRDKAIQQYFDFFEEAQKINDWRKWVGRVPIPEGCTKENVTIPETGGSIEWDRNIEDSTPSGVPIDPYFAS